MTETARRGPLSWETLGPSRLDEIREAAEKHLPQVPELESMVLKRAVEAIEYEGECVGTRLFNLPGIAACQQAHMGAGCEMPAHMHAEWEHLIVITGHIEVRFTETDALEAANGEVIYIPPMTSHTCRAISNTWLLGITVPPSGGYP